MEPYIFQKIIFNDGLINDSIDATYIIHLEDNGRIEHIKEQLLEYHPTNIVYILFNKGYKNSIKKSFINSPPLDLIDAFLIIFKHTIKYNYNNILILEDDFIFSKKIKEKEHIDIINKTIKKLEDTDFIYLLGCFPYLQIPYDLYNYRVLSTGMHAVIYSYKNRINTLNYKQELIKDWDIYNFQNINRFTYYIPLCYQLFYETENSKVWAKDINIVLYLLSKVLLNIFKLVKLDKQIEPGTTIFYYISKYLLWIIIVIIIIFYNKRK